ncbi:MAG: 3-isopropylmalate dehydratase small subunit [Candidatus Omnitrophota bacterium]|nr:3-isopropylmalate dehydratase small subunit [Candidatus Omnitrophota bacterium]
MAVKARAHKFGSDINTDDIIAAKYLNTTDRAELAGHCMEHIDKNFMKKIKSGDVMVAGRNFGCGSSREHAPAAIKAAGISCVIAESFARIFFRNSINIGLPIIESKEASERIREKDVIRVETKAGLIKNVTRKESYKIEKYPPFMQKIFAAGGLMAALKRRGKKGK